MKIHLKGNWNSKRVWLFDNELNPEESQKIFNHSPDGYAWGYNGSGPAQLALAVLLEITDEITAKVRYQDFKERYISLLPQENFDEWIDIGDFGKSDKEVREHLEALHWKLSSEEVKNLKNSKNKARESFGTALSLIKSNIEYILGYTQEIAFVDLQKILNEKEKLKL